MNGCESSTELRSRVTLSSIKHASVVIKRSVFSWHLVGTDASSLEEVHHLTGCAGFLASNIGSRAH